MSITRGVAIVAVCIVLSWQAGATDRPKDMWSVSDGVIISTFTKCLDGQLFVRRESDHAKRVRTKFGYHLNDNCNGGVTVASGLGRVPRDVMTGTGLTSLHVVADTRDFVDLDFRSEGEPIIIDMIFEPTEGDFDASRSYGRTLQDGVFTRFSWSGVSKTAKLTGTVNLFEPTFATISWNRQRNIERVQK